MLLRVLKFFFGIYGLLVFSSLLVIVTPFYFAIYSFGGKAAPHRAHFISRQWAAALLLLLFIRVKVIGRELIDPSKPYIIVSNHRSQLDIPLLAVSCSNTFRFLAKAELGKIPLLGYVIGNLYILVKREDVRDRTKSLDAMKNSLAEGISVALYPEGTRNRTTEPLLDFRAGAFRLAAESHAPVAVVTLINSGRLLSPNRAFELSPGKLYAIWEKPIDTTGMTKDDIPALKEKVRTILIKNLEEYREK